jgi:ribonuclease VapC
VIVIDASALVAILLDEPERDAFLEALGRSPACLSPVGYWEAATTLGRHRGEAGLTDLNRLIANFDIRIHAADEAVAKGAVLAEQRFGKRTAAKLNMGDCFAYALAKALKAPLLYKGDDFNRTDIQAALAA